MVAGVISQALARKGSQAALDEALQEIRHLHDRLTDDGGRGADESVEIRRDIKVLRSSRPVVSESSVIKRALAQVEQVAPTPATVLLLGETGAGKEVFAQAIHDSSPRHHRHMVRVSCAAIPPALIDAVFAQLTPQVFGAVQDVLPAFPLPGFAGLGLAPVEISRVGSGFVLFADLVPAA